MRCTSPGCGTELYPGDRFCGRCGQTVLPHQPPSPEAVVETPGDLFPLYGVTLGETPVSQLAWSGKRATNINKDTGRPHDYYEIEGINFWYNASGIAESLYIARGIYRIPEQWCALGFGWNLSYSQWINLLNRLGYAVTITQPPQVVRYNDHDSLSAQLTATRQMRIPIEIQLTFDYSRETTTDAQGTLYSILVKAVANR